jgi:hypothetical protein
LTKLAKCTTISLLLLLSSTILLSLAPSALAQTNTAEVILAATVGGTTSPAPGTYTYDSGTAITLTATPDANYVFKYWTISGGYISAQNAPPLIIPSAWIDPTTGELVDPDTGEPIVLINPGATGATYDILTATQNPLGVVCGYGYTYEYQAVFDHAPPTERTEAIVVVKSAAGGSTNPGVGTYTFAEGGEVTLTATATSGYVFQYWIASGTGTSGHENTLIVDNPLTVTCGVGLTYEYQPVFTPEGAVTTTEGIPATYFYAAVIILVILVAAGFGLALMYRGKK